MKQDPMLSLKRHQRGKLYSKAAPFQVSSLANGRLLVTPTFNGKGCEEDVSGDMVTRLGVMSRMELASWVEAVLNSASGVPYSALDAAYERAAKKAAPAGGAQEKP